MPGELVIDKHFALMDSHMSAPGFTYDAAIAEIQARMGVDTRINAILIGESDISEDERAVVRSIIRELAEVGWPISEIAVEGTIIDTAPLADLGIPRRSVDRNLTNDAHCEDLEGAAKRKLNHERVYGQYAGSGHLSRYICHYETLSPICNRPDVADVCDPGRSTNAHDHCLRSRYLDVED